MFSSFDPEVCMEVKRRCGFGGFVGGAVPGLVGAPCGLQVTDAWERGVPMRLKAAAGRLQVGGCGAGVVLCFAHQQPHHPAHPSAGGPTPLSCSSAVVACMRTPTPAAPAWQVTEQEQPAASRSRHWQHLLAAATWAPLLGGYSVIVPELLMWLLRLPAHHLHHAAAIDFAARAGLQGVILNTLALQVRPGWLGCCSPGSAWQPPWLCLASAGAAG